MGMVGQPAQRADQRGAEGQVGHEVPVHHIDMQPVGAAFRGPLDLLRQPAQIGAQNAGGDPHGHGAGSGPRLTDDCDRGAARTAHAGGRPGCQHHTALLTRGDGVNDCPPARRRR